MRLSSLQFNFTHNDIKLDNVLLDRRSGKLEAVLCDFELLKEETTIASDGTVTQVGGTPAYMAPERMTANHRPTKESDMYSVGVLILFCFAPSRIKEVTKDMNDPARVPAEALLAQVRKQIPAQVDVCLTVLLKSTPSLRPTARSFLGTTDQAGDLQDSYFSRADTDRPRYSLPSSFCRLIFLSSSPSPFLVLVIAGLLTAHGGQLLGRRRFWRRFGSGDGQLHTRGAPPCRRAAATA